MGRETKRNQANSMGEGFVASKFFLLGKSKKE
jgi:hypothetical protein